MKTEFTHTRINTAGFFSKPRRQDAKARCGGESRSADRRVREFRWSPGFSLSGGNKLKVELQHADSAVRAPISASSRRLTRHSVATAVCAFALMLLPLCLPAATNDLTGALQRGLFEEEANRNLDAAAQAYQAVSAQFDQDRKLAATAIFRLGEVYRKQGRTNDAVAQYERIVREFPEEQTLATLSRQNLGGLRLAPAVAGDISTPGGTGNASEEASRLAAQLKGIEQLKDNPEEQARALLAFFPDETLKQMLLQLPKLKEQEAIVRENPTLQYNELSEKLAEKLGNNSTANGGGYHTAFGPDGFDPERHSTNFISDAHGELTRQLSWIKERVDFTLGVQKARLQVLQAVGAKTPIVEAATTEKSAPSTDDEEKEIRRIQAMIQNSPDLINAPSGDPNLTPLCRGARDGQLRVAKFLLDKGAEVNQQVNQPNSSLNGRTPLHFAADGGHRAMVELLLQRGAAVNVTELRVGYTALHFAATKGFQAVAETLVTAKADVNALSKNERTPLHLCVSGNRPTITAFLVAKGAKVDVQDDQGQTPLIFAASSGHLEILDTLLAAKANPNLKDKNGGTALYYAAKVGPVGCVKVLLAAKADPNVASENEGGATPLHVAVARGDRESVKLLLEHGAKPSATAHYGNPDATPLMLAASQKDAELVALLLKSKADLNLVDARGNTALLNAVLSRSPEVVRTLLADGANPDTKNGNGFPVLMLSVTDAQSKEVAAALIEAKADVNAPDPNGKTPLHWAAEFKRKDFVELLINAGADVNLRDKSGLTPLDMAKGSQRQPQPGLNAFAPRTLRSPVGPGSSAKTETPDIAAFLRQHGALDDLPDFNRIEVSRASSGYRATVFTGNTNGWSRYTLVELLAQQFGLVSVQTHGLWPTSRGNRRELWGGNSLRFPDFNRITIQRPGTDGKSRSAIPLNLSGLAKTNGTADDVPLQFGDVVEVPEADHPVSEVWAGPAFPDLQALTNILSRHITLVVGDKSMELVLAPGFRESGIRRMSTPDRPPESDYALEAASFMLRSVLDQTKLVRSSSDLTRVKVTRTDSSDGNPRTWVVDCSDGKQMPDLWLRDGDVVEVPDRSESISATIKRVVVVGEVRTPGTIDIPANEKFTAAKAILKSGGFNDFANKKKVKVIRKGAGGGTNTTIEVNMVEIFEQGKVEQDIELQADDMVIVPKRNINF